MTGGEGWHNYHHVFPWDYKTAELGNYRYNISTAFIDFFAKIGKAIAIFTAYLLFRRTISLIQILIMEKKTGWAYDLKSVSDDVIQKRMARCGDGDTQYSRANPEDLARVLGGKELSDETEPLIWGWDDADFKDDEKSNATILNKQN